MKNKIKTLIAMSFLAGAMFSCTEVEPLALDGQAAKDLYEIRDKDKWAAEEAQKEQNIQDSIRISEENKRKYELYLADLVEYKKTKHLVMFGWFNAWSATTPGEYSQLNLIPDSMDIVSIWGNRWDLDEARMEQLKEVQSKGTKVIVGYIVENVGNGLNHPKNTWSDDPEEGVIGYAKSILDSIAKYNYDGFDIDYEPSYSSPFKPGNHCGDWPRDENWDIDWDNWYIDKPIISCSSSENKELENLFFQTLRDGLNELAVKNNKQYLLNLNGSIHYLDPAMAGLFDYFVPQSYNGGYSSWTGQITSHLGQDTKDKIIYTQTFENNKTNRDNFLDYAKYVKDNLGGEAGGIGAYHINEDTFSFHF
jgi:hypothetical protein